MTLPQDLKFNPSEPDKNNEFIFIDISPLQVGTPYKFQFQWVFADQKLNDLVGDRWSNTYNYLSKSAAKPSKVTNLRANWLPNESDPSKKTNTLYVRFDHDTTLNNGTTNNTGVDKYRIEFTYNGGLGPGGGGTAGVEGPYSDYLYENKPKFYKTVLAKEFELTKAMQVNLGFDFFRNKFTVKVYAIDTFNRTESDPESCVSETYTGGLAKPSVTLTGKEFAYDVAWSSSNGMSMEELAQYVASINVEEVVTDSLTEPTSGWTLVRSGFTNPLVVPATAQWRWVRTYFLETTGVQSEYSTAARVKPSDPIQDAIDTTAPPNLESVTAVWNGNDIDITPVFASGEDSVRFIIELTSNSITRPFLRWKNQLVNGKLTITQNELYSAFGQHYTVFTGRFKTIDKFDNANTGITFNVAQKVNPLLGVTPTFVLTAITNGYTVTWTQPTSAAYAKIYESGTSWGAGNPLETDLVFSGQSPAIVKKTVYTLRYIKIKYLTVDGFESSWSAEQTVTPLDSISADTTAPAAPSAGLTATSGIDTSGTMGFNGFINLSWTAVSDTTLRGYRIRFRPVTTPASNYSYIDSPGTGTTYRISGLAVGATYEVGIASYDEFNNTSTSYTSFSNQAISGVPAISNYITAGAAGFQFGSGIKDSTGAQNASAQGIYLSNNNYWYLTAADTAKFKVGGSTANFLEWTGSALNIDGNITAKGGSFSGNIELKTSGASIWNGVLNSGGTLAGDGFVLNNNGLSLRKTTTASVTAASWSSGLVTYTSNNLFVNGQTITVSGSSNTAYNITGVVAGRTATSFQLSLVTNPGTFSGTATASLIRNIRLDSTDGGIYTDFGNIAGWTIDAARIERLTSSQYSGISSSGTYAFYAGASASGNSAGDTGAPFWVKPDGSVRASNISITGGSLTIGANFSVLSSGVMTASGADITGKITATSGKIANINIDSASLYISDAATPSTSAGNRIIFNAGGIAAYPSGTTGSGLAGTETTPAGTNATFAITKNGLALFQKGYIANWVVEADYIQGSDATASTTLHKNGRITSINGSYFVGINPGATSGTSIVLWAGQSNSTNGTITKDNADTRASEAQFYVQANGTMRASNAIISGTVSAGSGTAAGALVRIGKDADGTTNSGNHGIFLAGTSDYIYSTGNFKLGDGRLTNTSTGLTIQGATTINGGEVTFQVTGSLESDSNNFAGDPTLTLASISNQVGASRLTLGRRFLFNGTNNVPNPPINFGVSPNRSDEGNWTANSGTTTKVKIGDICFIY